eukprot:392519_1
MRYFFGMKYVRDLLSVITSTLITNSFMEQYIRPTHMKPIIWNSLQRSFCKSWSGLTSMSKYIISDWSDIDFNALATIDKIMISSNLNDTINVPSMQQCLHRLLNGSVLITIPNATHHDVMDQATDLLNRFVLHL